MLQSHGFDLWASENEQVIKKIEESYHYPFAGYRDVMNTVFGTIMTSRQAKVLDIGVGTGRLAAQLSEGGHDITGVDMSIEKVSNKLEKLRFLSYDFSKGLPEVLKNETFDYIVSTYAMHQLKDDEKITLIHHMLDHLKPDGTIIIGDISFFTREELETCRNSHEDWNVSGSYLIFLELFEQLRSRCQLYYTPISHCSGLIEITLKN